MPAGYAIVALAFIVAAIGLALRPGEAERAAILVRDGRMVDALAEVVRQGVRSSSDQRTVLTHIQLLRGVGDFEGALQQLEDYASSTPDSLAAQLALLEAHQELGRTSRVQSVAERIFERWRRPEAFLVLLRHHRQDGNVGGELDLLRKAAFVGIAQIPDIERLALIEAAGDHKSVAMQHLIDVDATRTGLTFAGRLTLLHMLIEAGRIGEAERRARRWVMAARAGAAVLEGQGEAEICFAFAASGHPALGSLIIESSPGKWGEHTASCVDRLINLDDLVAAADVLRQARHRGDEYCGAAEKLAVGAGRIGIEEVAMEWERIRSACEAARVAEPKSLPGTARLEGGECRESELAHGSSCPSAPR